MKSSFKISLATAVTLMYNLYTTKDKDLDADNLFEELISKLGRHQISVPTDDLESFLAFSNYNAEDGKFFHPNKVEFKTFVRRVIGKGFKYDAFYNTIEESTDE